MKGTLLRTVPLLAQAKQRFGWEPKVPLREGLAMMLDDFAERLRVTKPKAEALLNNVLAKDQSKA